jgi:N-acetylglucosaminyl-diphospho-decaprenol L-rhamnosyltransferase
MQTSAGSARDADLPAGSAPDLSVVIVNFNALAHVRRCLASLTAGAAGLRWETVVVDNASRELGVEGLAAEFPGVRVLRRARNDGFAVGANAGIRAARADAVLLLNPDTVLRPGAAAELLRLLRSEPGIGAVGPRIENPDGTLQLSCRRFPTLWAGLFNRYSLLTRLWPRNPASSAYLMTDWDHASTRDVDWLSGAALLLSKAALERVGLFDERYFFAVEDVDLCRRLHAAGLRVVYHPAAVVMHRIGASAATVPNRVIVAHHRGMWRYYRTYLRGGPLLDVLAAAGITVRCLVQLLLANLRCRSAPPDAAS